MVMSISSSLADWADGVGAALNSEVAIAEPKPLVQSGEEIYLCSINNI